MSDDKPGKFLPDMDAIDRLVLKADKMVDEARKAIASVQAIIDQVAAMDELRAYIQPQGPIEVVVPLKSQLPR